MSLVLADRVRQTSTTTGSGTFTLDGSVTGFQSFSAIGDGNTTYYTITLDSQWEVGIGTYSAGTLTRDTVISSSTGSKIVFGAGTKDVFVCYPAEKSVNQDANNRVLIPYTSGVTNVGSLNVGNATAHTDSGVIAGFTASEPLYLYTSLQNTSSANTSYASYAVNDGGHTAYAELGINNANYSYSAAGYPNNGFSTPLASFVESYGGPLVLGSWDNQKISFIVNGAVNTADAMTIETTGAVTIPNATVTGGTINNATIGATTAATGSFTNITGSANAIISVTDNTNAALRITQLGTGNALLVEDSTNPDATPFVVDANGQIIQGYTTAINNWNGAPDSIASHSTASNARPSVGLYNWSSNTARVPGFYLYKSVSNTVGTQGAVANLQLLGRLVFNGDDGATFIRAAEIDAFVDGTPGLNDMPGALRFNTTPDGASAPIERVRISSTGNVGIGTTANASAILDAQSTTKGVRMPNMTTTQKNAIASPATGLMVFDTTLAKLCVYSGTAWQTVTSV